jgi:hypothetical protein
MEASFKAGKVTFKLEANTQKDMFKLLAETSEVFGEPSCGLCGSTEFSFGVRTVDGNDFHELVCTEPKCGARLSMGQSKQQPGKLFPIRALTADGRPSRKDGQRDFKGRGWTKYRGKPVNNDETSEPTVPY